MRLYLVAPFLLAFAVTAQPPTAQRPAESKPPDIDRAIAAVEERLNSALAQRDRPTLERLIAAPFTWVHASDRRVDSQEVWLTMAFLKGLPQSFSRNPCHHATPRYSENPSKRLAVTLTL